MSLLPAEIVQTGNSPSTSIIWLHGLGADGHDFAPIVPQLDLPADCAVRFVFPHAPMQAVTINGGYVMRAWYDIVSPNLRQGQDEQGIVASQQHLVKLIEKEIDNGIVANRIVLAGFSQGGAIALYTALRYPQALAGVMALSTYLPLADSTEQQRTDSNQNIPVFMAHGSHDPIVPLQAGEQSKQLMEKMDYKVTWNTYPMEHSVCAEEMDDISRWLSGILVSGASV